MCQAVEFLERLNNISNDIFTYHSDLHQKLSQFDLMEQDILHKIENDSFNASQGYKLAKTLKSIRQQRRAIKNEIETLKYVVPIQQSISDRINDANSSIAKTTDRLNRSKYRPRTDILKAI